MARRDIVVEGASILRGLAVYAFPGTKYVNAVIRDMWDTMQGLGHNCAGLAAPQIGENANICILRRKSLVLINPTIIERIGKVPSIESCYSIPGYEAIIPRAKKVSVSYLDEHGKTKYLVTHDVNEAIAVQHEVDHLSGILIKDYVEKEHGKAGGVLVSALTLTNSTYVAYVKQTTEKLSRKNQVSAAIN